VTRPQTRHASGTSVCIVAGGQSPYHCSEEPCMNLAACKRVRHAGCTNCLARARFMADRVEISHRRPLQQFTGSRVHSSRRAQLPFYQRHALHGTLPERPRAAKSKRRALSGCPFPSACLESAQTPVNNANANICVFPQPYFSETIYQYGPDQYN